MLREKSKSFPKSQCVGTRGKPAVAKQDWKKTDCDTAFTKPGNNFELLVNFVAKQDWKKTDCDDRQHDLLDVICWSLESSQNKTGRKQIATRKTNKFLRPPPLWE